MARILLENITKIFGDNVTAVNNATLEVVDQEFMVVVGPTGCGKTTILRMIAGLERATSGTVTIGDTVVNDIPPKDRDITMVFQNYALYPHMTVFQNMAFGLKLRKYPKAEIKKLVEDAAKLLGIEQLFDRKPKALSGGQRQRVALGRAIVRNPNAFLFDEPLSNLDAKLRVSTRAELKALHHRLKTTTVYVTHDQAEAMTLSDRICVMHNGLVQQVASPMEIYDRPVNKFVAGFLGTPPMNFFEGRIDFDQDKFAFVTSDTKITLPKRLKDKIANYKNDEMLLGIRPEHLSPIPIQEQEGNELKATIDVVEPLGDKTEVYLTTKSGKKFVANIDPYTEIKASDILKTYVDINHIHIFEPSMTGKNVNLI